MSYNGKMPKIGGIDNSTIRPLLNGLSDSYLPMAHRISQAQEKETKKDIYEFGNLFCIDISHPNPGLWRKRECRQCWRNVTS